MKDQIKKALDEIRPSLQADGGDVELVAIEGGLVKVRLRGACAGCPMSQVTLKDGIERYLKNQVAGVERVEKVE